jgi:uncharacterized protein
MKNASVALIIAIGVIFSGLILSSTYKNRYAFQNTITVTGSGETYFTSDLIVWRGTFARSSMVLKTAYTELKSDEDRIRVYLSNHGVRPEDIVFSAVTIAKEQKEKFNAEGRRIGSDFAGYRLSQSVRVESSEIDKIEKISREITELIQAGLELDSAAPAFHYTKLSELKIDLLGKAAAAGRLRAETVAKSSHSKLGKLKNASVGVFQIVGRHSEEAFTWQGAFNTTDKNKSAQITIKMEFELN